MRGHEGGWEWDKHTALHLTTRGRRTGLPRRVELWFAARGGRVYLLGHAGSHWLRNLQADPRVEVQIGRRTARGLAHLADEKREEVYALFARKYGRAQMEFWYGAGGTARRAVEISLPLDA